MKFMKNKPKRVPKGHILEPVKGEDLNAINDMISSYLDAACGGVTGGKMINHLVCLIGAHCYNHPDPPRAIELVTEGIKDYIALVKEIDEKEADGA